MYHKPRLPYPFSNCAECDPATERSDGAFCENPWVKSTPQESTKGKEQPCRREASPYKEPPRRQEASPCKEPPRRQEASLCKEPPRWQEASPCKEPPRQQETGYCPQPTPYHKTSPNKETCTPKVEEKCCEKNKQCSTLVAQNSCCNGSSNQMPFLILMLYLFGVI